MIKKGTRISTNVYRKPTDSGLLLHYQSQVDNRYKTGLIKTMLYRAKKLSSSPESFQEECARIRSRFLQLKYPDTVIKFVISKFIAMHAAENASDLRDNSSSNKPKSDVGITISLPFKDQKSARIVKQQLSDRSNKVGKLVRPVFVSKKLGEQLRIRERRPDFLIQQCVVYHFKCDRCDAGYFGYTCRHLYQRVGEHRATVVGKHLKEMHGQVIDDLFEKFCILRKCTNKFDCLIFKMLFIKWTI